MTTVKVEKTGQKVDGWDVQERTVTQSNGDYVKTKSHGSWIGQRVMSVQKGNIRREAKNS